ncbi:MAG: TonB-dependent receptor, partial [Verrucomicrobiota bacterium]
MKNSFIIVFLLFVGLTLSALSQDAPNVGDLPVPASAGDATVVEVTPPAESSPAVSELPAETPAPVEEVVEFAELQALDTTVVESAPTSDPVPGPRSQPKPQYTAPKPVPVRSTSTPRVVAPAPVATVAPPVVNEVVVAPTRTPKLISDVPTSVGVVSEDQIAQLAPLSFDDMLRSEPNVDFSGGPRYLGEQLIVRGEGGNAVTVRIDDARQNFVSGHSGQRFFVETDFLKEVEVIRGGGSFLYGSGSAGVLNVSTLDPEDLIRSGENFGARIRNTYQTNTDEWGHSFLGAAGNETVKIMAGYATRDGDNITQGDGRELLYSGIERESAIGKLVFTPSDEMRFEFGASGYTSTDQGGANPQTLAVGTSSNDLVQREIQYNQFTGDWSWNPELNDLIDTKATFYYNTTEQSRSYAGVGTANNIGRTNNQKLEVFGIDINNRSVFDSVIGQHEVVVGIDYFTEDQSGIDTRGTFNITGTTNSSSGRPNATADHIGIYLTDEIDLTDNLTVFGGLRYDSYNSDKTIGSTSSQSASELLPHIGFDLDVTDKISIFGQYSKGFTAPTMNQLYADGSHFGVVPQTDPNDVFAAFGRFAAQAGQIVSVNQPMSSFVFPPFGPPIPTVVQNNVPVPATPAAVTQDEIWFEEVFIPNPGLEPETSDNFELGVHFEDDDFLGGKFSSRFTAFLKNGKNTFDSEIVGQRVSQTSVLGVSDIPAEPAFGPFPGAGDPFAAPSNFLFPTGGGLDFNSQLIQA